MTFELEGKNAFITGSSSGIGLAIAQKLQFYGCNIAINSRNNSDLKSASDLFAKPVVSITSDMSNELEASNAVLSAVNQLGSLDILVCNIGSGRSAPPCTETFSDWQSSLSTNLLSATNVISPSLDYLSLSSGSITCISSICAEKMVEGAPLTYASSKAALNRFVINASPYLAKRSVRINAIAPGNVLFSGSVWEKKMAENPSFVKDMLERDVPMRTFITPTEVSDAVAFLSSPLSRYTTGQVLAIDAGQSIA